MQRKKRQIMSLLMAVVMSLSLVQFTIYADNEEISSSRKPDIQLDGDEKFIQGQPYRFTVCSDISGLLTVVSDSSNDVIVNGQRIEANEPFEVIINQMPNQATEEFTITVRPENTEYDNPDELYVSSIAFLKVVSEPTELIDEETQEEPNQLNEHWTEVWMGDNNNPPSIEYTPSKENPDIIKMAIPKDTGKIDSSSNQGLYYYRALDNPSLNFRISGSIKINNIESTTNSQTAAGIMVSDQIDGKDNPATAFSGFLHNGSMLGNPMMIREKGGSVKRIGGNALTFEKGIVFETEMVKVGNQYYTYINNQLAETGTLALEEGSPVYIGLFACRGIEAEFSDLDFEILDDTNTPQSLTITSPPDLTDYVQFSDPELEGLEASVIINDNEVTIDSRDYTVSGVSTDELGQFTASVNYRGSSDSFTYTVIEDKVKEIAVLIPPLKLIYAIGEKLDTTAIEVIAVMHSGRQVALHKNDFTIGEVDTKTPGTKQVEIIYDTFSTYFDIQVKDLSISSVSIKEPRKTAYFTTDEAPNLEALFAGSIIYANYSDGTDAMLDLADLSHDYDPQTFIKADGGPVEVTLTYLDVYSASVTFEIIPQAAEKLTPKTYPKTTYTIGESLDFSKLAVAVLYNDGSLSPSISAEDYEINSQSYNSGVTGVYTINILGKNQYAQYEGAFDVTVREETDYSKGWNHISFGQSARAQDNTHEMISGNYGEIGPDTEVALNTTDGRGKVADGHDGINYYYRALNINDNFRLEADVEVVTFSSLDGSDIYGQEAFGIMLRDRIGPNGDTSVWPSSILFAGARGSLDWNAYYRDNRKEYEDGITATNSKIGLTGNPAAFSRDGSGEGSAARIVLERKNNQFTGSITAGGETGYFSFDHDIPLDYYDEDQIYIGFFTARNAHIRFSNASLTVSDAGTDAPGPEIPKKLISPELTIRSISESSDSSYRFIYSANADGTANVYYNSQLIHSSEITANTLNYVSYELNESSNAFTVEFIPDSEKDYENYQRIIRSLSVDLLNGLDLVYVSPAGGGIGTQSSPMSINEAIRHVKSGGEIILTSGSYGILNIPKYNSGKTGKYKTITAQEGVTTGNIGLHGDFWHLKGLEVKNAGVHVSGSDNILELLTIYGSSQTGLQISRSGDSSIYNHMEVWPARNLILNCESYNHKDPAEDDADGFAAKLTVGDLNTFIGCIAHHNIDDGWDLYAKSVPIGRVIIDSCIAYHNGHVTGNTEKKGDGNGFKLGGEGVPVMHEIRNSIAFHNNVSGYTSNSNPTLIAENNVSFDNFGQNISFISYTNVDIRDYRVVNFYSYRKEIFEDPYGSKDSLTDKIESVDANGNIVTDGYDISVYLYNEKTGLSQNKNGRTVTDDFFVSTIPPLPAVSESEIPTYYDRDGSIENVPGSESYKSNIITGDFLQLTDFAKEHTN